MLLEMGDQCEQQPLETVFHCKHVFIQFVAGAVIEWRQVLVSGVLLFFVFYLDSLSLVTRYCICSAFIVLRKKKESDKEDVMIVLCSWLSLVFNAERGESKIK